ncbi:MAG TPA: exodeoxyribonuclease V subunit gamma [Oscillospiraceae bacterium]|nr:exodeoxyribonuclease V subunit gamma [Oscillospiraceae bacterium]HPF55423.1 exodeoxyribonuclease V subunit gamma [Clostridiales bacterium]HPK34459.1 exodeoxyribonuclease V subunit gamma [Oscillospiraceae bacterium]
MLRFIVGPAMSGKTWEIQKQAAEYAEKGEKVLFVVPEQFVFSSEQMLLKAGGERFMRTAEVLSLSKLAHAQGADGCKMADAAAKQALMSLAVSQVSDELTIYKKQSARADFIPMALAAIHRLKRAALDETKLHDLFLRAKSPFLKQKLSDLALLSGAYNAVMGDKYFDPDDDMKRLAEILEDNNPYKGACIFFDAFKDFTGVEYDVLRPLVRDAKEAVFTFASDRENFLKCGSGALFSTVDRTALKLIETAKETRQPVAETEFLENTYFNSAFLASAEKTFRTGATDVEGPYDGSLRMTRCSGPVEEAERVSQAVENLVRKGDIRYKDAVIIARDCKPLQGILDRALAKYNIPFFWDNRKPLSASPVFRFLRGALEVACGDGAKLLGCLKSGFFDLDQKSVCKLENYAIENGKRTLSDFRSPWPDPEIDQVRASAMQKLDALSAGIDKSDPIGFARAVYEFLQTSGVRKRFDELVELEKIPRLEAIMTDPRRAYNTLMTLLDSFVAALSENEALPKLSKRRYCDILNLMADAMTIGEIPEHIDCLQVGDADLIRPANAKAVFVIGANSGVFPADPSEFQPFSASESRELAELGADLADEPERQIADEDYLVYSALFCARDYLWVSYNSANLSGTEKLQPSPFVNRLIEIAPDAEKIPESGFAERVFNPEQAALLLTESDPDEYASLEAALKDTGHANLAEALKESAEYGKTQNARNASALLFGRNMHLSPSQVESFSQCRFAYFCNYGLGARPIRQKKLDAVQWGTAVHYVMQHLLQKYPQGVTALSDETLTSEIGLLLDEAVKLLMPPDFSPSGEAKFFLEKLKAGLVGDARRISEHLDKSLFKIDGCEIEIGPDKEIPPLDYAYGDTNVMLRGKIDRVDRYDAPDGKTYLSAVDYKTGSTNFTMASLADGSKIQLAYYLKALCADGSKYSGCIPAAFFYFPLNVKSEISNSDEPSSRIRPNGKLQGFFRDGDTFAAMGGSDYCKFTRNSGGLDMDGVFGIVDNLVTDMAQKLAEGDFTAMPAHKSDCKFCDYYRVCSFRGKSNEDGEEAESDA